MNPCQQVIRNTDIVFNNMAVRIVPPHMPFQTPLIITLTIDFGNGTITTATYQVIGDNLTDTTLYMQGGGGISIQGDSKVYTGAVRLNGNIHYQSEPQRLVTQYNGTVKITETCLNKVTLSAELYAVGQGPLDKQNLKAKLDGEGTVNVVCGLKTITFPNSSLSLAILLPS